MKGLNGIASWWNNSDRDVVYNAGFDWPNGKYALVPHAKSGTLMVGDVAGQRVIRHIPLRLTRVDEPSTAGVFPHPDNIHAFVTVRNDNSMLLVNLETGETLARVEVQSSPDGVAYSPVQR